MNREILFRGKRVDNGEWVEGFYFKKISPIFPNRAEHFISFQQKDKYDFPDPIVISQKVNPDTVGQYIGLTDKHGTKIFEGDILHFINTYPHINKEWLGLVEMMEGAFVYRYGDGSYNYFRIWKEPVVKWSIVGNIHDNPELLEGEAYHE